MSEPRVGIMGTGYWAYFQVGAWQALGVPVVAVWNRTRHRADAFAARLGIPVVCDTPEELLSRVDVDLVDVIADVDAHESLVRRAAHYGKPVICQKPMARTLDGCRRMVDACAEADVWFAVHENFRYQPPTVALKNALDSGVCGPIVRAHLIYRSPDRAIMDKQPALKTMDHMALRDMGPHLYDVARYLFGEIRSLTTLPVQAYADLPVMTGALSLLRMASGLPVQADLTHDWPYRVYVRGERATLILDCDMQLHTITVEGETVSDTRAWEYLPYIPRDDWDLHGGHVFASIPACLSALRDAFLKGQPAPTSGADNYRSMQAVLAAIRSVDAERTVALDELD